MFQKTEIDSISEQSEKKPLRKIIIKRSIIVIALFITAFHLLSTFLWIAPASAARDVIPNNILTKYMIPFFGQSWSVFAPEPINADYYFDVRAIVEKPNGDTEVTEWIRATDVELDRATYNFFPPRSAGLGVKVSSELKGSWDNLSVKQKEIVKSDYFKGDDYKRLSNNLSKDNNTNISDYVKKETTATAYATQVSKAIWGDNVVRVQYQAARQNVILFNERNNKDAVRPSIQPVHTGWRGLVVKPHQSNKEFAEYFCASDKVRCTK